MKIIADFRKLFVLFLFAPIFSLMSSNASALWTSCGWGDMFGNPIVYTESVYDASEAWNYNTLRLTSALYQPFSAYQTDNFSLSSQGGVQSHWLYATLGPTYTIQGEGTIGTKTWDGLFYPAYGHGCVGSFQFTLPTSANISISPAVVTVGDLVTVTWSSTQANDCKYLNQSYGPSGVLAFAATTADAGSYQIECSNPWGSIWSNIVYLTVNEPAPISYDIGMVPSVSSLMLLDNYTLSASIAPTPQGSASVTNIKFQISANQSTWYNLGEGLSPVFNGVARRPGNLYYRAVVTISGATYQSAAVNMTTNFPTYDRIVGAAELQGPMDSAWAATLAASNPINRREYCFWIQIDTINGQYVAGNQTPGPVVDNDIVEAECFLPAKPLDQSGPDVAQGGLYTIALFHTHPAHNWVGQPRVVGPSLIDHNAANGANVVGIVRDYIATESNNMIGAYHPAESAVQDSHFGPFRRQL